jgi:alkylation response protein AidB-like acyl-CoA dehydrogenase
VIDFALSEENRLVAQSVRELADGEIALHIRDRDAASEVHVEVFRQVGDLGHLGAPIPERYGARCEPLPAEGFDRLPAGATL